jgi:predicted TIM-barrel fold metal-dependent hydrolase
MWELPKLCRFARPKFVAEAAKRNPEAVFIIAHMGAYSMLMPGIFFREALNAASELDNVYLDTSAVEPLFIERAVEEIGYDKLLYGSDFPYVVGVNLGDTIMEILKLNIPEKAKRAILRFNAERLLKRLDFI